MWFVPSCFHSYGHKASCQVLATCKTIMGNGCVERVCVEKFFPYIAILQVLYGPRRCEGIGLSDGEMMEQMWSYLRRFSRMTKEMRPSHRIDVISSALIHYGWLKKKSSVTGGSTSSSVPIESVLSVGTEYVVIHMCIFPSRQWRS